MECQVCLDKFNATDRRPKVLPCGHTYCLRCLKQLPEQLCPTDRQAFAEHPDNLVDNFQILNLPERPTLWCCSCQKEATSKECLEWHTLCSMKKARTETASPLLKRLKTAMEDAALQVDTMAKVRDLVMEHTSSLASVVRKLRDADATLQRAIETDTEDLAVVMTDAERALAESVTAKACPAAKDGGGILRVTMTQSSKTWSADLNLQEAKVDQVFQGLGVVTEGQLTWQQKVSPAYTFGSSALVGPAGNATTVVPGLVFGENAPSKSGPGTAAAAATASSLGLFGSASSMAGSDGRISSGSSLGTVFGIPTPCMSSTSTSVEQSETRPRFTASGIRIRTHVIPKQT